jgi:hypothetical protein
MVNRKQFEHCFRMRAKLDDKFYVQYEYIENRLFSIVGYGLYWTIFKELLRAKK